MTPRAPTSVEVFMLRLPTRAFVEVGLVHVEQSSDVSSVSPAELAGRVRQNAAQVGCDAVVMQAADAQYGSGMALTTYTARAFRASCIMCKDGASSRPTMTDNQLCADRDAEACFREATRVEAATDKMHFWQKACDLKHPRACTHAGYAYYKGDGVTQNASLAETLLVGACDQRDALGCRYLGVLLMSRDDGRTGAIQKLQLACDDGDAWSCWKLGETYATDEKAAEQAAILFRRACKLGYDVGCNALR